MLAEITEHLRVLGEWWGHKLLTVQGTKLSLGNLVMALLMLAMATRVSRFIASLTMRRLVEPFVHEKNVLGSYRRLVFMGSFALCVVLALTFAGIPLTIFTVVGGALAIGVGFGSQNVVSNFISGMILMFERPVKVGDVVEMDGVKGVITDIGTRSTRLRTLDNKHWIIPNSAFLEKNVLNWTLEDSVVRQEVKFGVSYGSDLQKVHNTVLGVVRSYPHAEKEPAPRLSFDDFGDSALLFRCIYWCDIDRLPPSVEAPSDLRFLIDAAFRQAGIEMSYPQRDLHLKSATTLNVQLHN